MLSEVAGRERNKEEVLDAVRPYKSQDDDKFDIQDRRRQGKISRGTSEIEKTLNSEVVLSASESWKTWKFLEF